jgi:hypothetical protein
MLLSAILKGLQAQDRRVYTNLQLQGATPRIEDVVNLHEGSDEPKSTKTTQEATTLQDLFCELKNLLTLTKTFRAY